MTYDAPAQLGPIAKGAWLRCKTDQVDKAEIDAYRDHQIRSSRPNEPPLNDLTTRIIPLDTVPAEMVEALLDRAFGPERRARTAYRVREGVDWLPALSFAALDENDHLLGTIQCWPVGLNTSGGSSIPMIMVGPVAVLPQEQRSGVGKALMAVMLEALGPNPALPQILIGDPEYYERFFGFCADRTGGWSLPGPFDPSRLLLRAAPGLPLPDEGTLGPWLRGEAPD